MKRLLYLLIAAASAILVSCGGRGNGTDLPDDFNQMGDAAKVDWLISQKVAPDSVARFICRAALGEIEGARIDTMANAVLYAFDRYHDDDLAQFSAAYDDFKGSQPLDKKMRIYLISGETDSLGVGYQLGLEYVAQIRENHLSADQAQKQIDALRKVCASSPDIYTRFVKGFRLALEADKGKDLNPEIYNRFINLQ